MFISGKPNRLLYSVACRLLSAVCVVSLLTTLGCSHCGLHSARENFYLGKQIEAADNLNDISGEKTNRILLLMERGTIQQTAHNYRESTIDWVNAWEMAEELDYYSLSRGASSFVINERVKMFQGMPYERTLLHSFAAKSYMAMQMWDDAAVEARNIIYRAQNLDKFPDDAYARYLAGLCMEMIYDSDAAARQYKVANKLTPHLEISNSGQITPDFKSKSEPKSPTSYKNELVCFVLIGRSPTEHGNWSGNYKWGATPYAEIYSKGEYLGRSYTLANTQTLLTETHKRIAAIKALKTASRIIFKESIAEAVSSENELLGEIIRLILYSLESPEERRWETLPMWLQVARVPCPDDIKEYKVKFKGLKGNILYTKQVTQPLAGRSGTYVSFCRDLPDNSIKKTSEQAKAE